MIVRESKKLRKVNESHTTDIRKCKADKTKDEETKTSNGNSGALLEYRVYINTGHFYEGFEFCIDLGLSDTLFLSLSFDST